MIQRIFLTGMALLLYATFLWAQDKPPIPADAAQAKALNLIKEIYGDEWDAAKTPAQKETLATKLLQKANESADDANRYVLLDVARNVAAQAGDVELAFKAIDLMAAGYDVDAYKLKGAALSQAAKEASTEQSVAVAKASLALIDEAVERDEIGAAKYLGGLAVDAARKGKDYKLVKEIIARNEEVEDIAKAYAGIQDALAALKSSPVDPDANLAVGKYHCFLKGNWDRGLPMLALGNDAVLKKLAIKELKGVQDADGQVTLGDAWWDLAGASEGVEQKQLQGRAALWYRKALPGLSGLVKDKVEKRLGQQETSDAQPAPRPQRARLRPIGGGTVETVRIGSQRFSNKPYRWSEQNGGNDLAGMSFIRSNVETTAAECVATGVVYVMTASSTSLDADWGSQEVQLRKKGFEVYRIYDGPNNTKQVLMRKTVQKGEIVRCDTWGIIVF